MPVKNNAIAGKLEGLLAAQQAGDGPPLVKHGTAPSGEEEQGTHKPQKRAPLPTGGMNAALAAAAAGKFKEREASIQKSAESTEAKLQQHKQDQREVHTNEHLDEDGNVIVKASEIKKSQGGSGSTVSKPVSTSTSRSAPVVPAPKPVPPQDYQADYEGFDMEQRLKAQHRKVHGSSSTEGTTTAAAKKEPSWKKKSNNNNNNSVTTEFRVNDPNFSVKDFLAGKKKERQSGSSSKK